MSEGIIKSINLTDEEVRELMDAADECGMPTRSRELVIPGRIGTIYGVDVVMDPDCTTPRIQTKAVTRLSLEQGATDLVVEYFRHE